MLNKLNRNFNRILLKEIAQVDLRSLALWRIFTGLALLYDLLFYKLAFVKEFYVPGNLRFTVAGTNSSLGQPILEAINTPAIFYTILVTGVILALAYTIGLLNSFFKIMLLLIHIILSLASEHVSNGFVALVEVSLFWSLLLPVDTCFTFRRKNRKSRSHAHPLAVLGLFLQIALIYTTTFVLKNSDAWTQGTAVATIINDLFLATDLGISLRIFPTITTMLTYLTLAIEIAIPLLILFPLKTYFRTIATVLIIGLHLGISMLINVGPFFIITTGLAMSLLPSSFWELFSSRTKQNAESDKKITIRPFKFYSFKSIAFVFLLLFMIRANVKHWYVQGYASSILQSVPGMGFLCYKFQPSSAVLHSVVNQPWGFFKLDKQEEFGAFIFIGTTKDGKTVNLTSPEIHEIQRSRLVDVTVNNPSNLQDAMYIHMINLRHYKEQAAPTTVFQETLKNRLEHWQAANPQVLINNATLYFLSKKMDSSSLKNPIYLTSLETVVTLNLAP